MNEYRIERLTETNLTDLIPLMRDAFGLTATTDGLRLRFDTRALGAWTLGHIAYHAESGEAAAYYGVFPCMAEFEGRTALAAQSGDTMTHSRHRGKGLFVALARMTYDLARESGVQFIFGFPNANSYPGFIKHLNWTHTENLRRYAITVPALPFERWAARSGPGRAVYQAYAKRVLAAARRRDGRGFPSSALEAGAGAVRRDAAYYEYKARNGSFVIRAGGTRVWIKIDRAILIGDIEGNNSAALDGVLKSLRRLGIALGIRRIVFQTSPGTPWDRAFAERFAPEEGLPIGWLDLGGAIPPGRLRYTHGDMDIF